MIVVLGVFVLVVMMALLAILFVRVPDETERPDNVSTPDQDSPPRV